MWLSGRGPGPARRTRALYTVPAMKKLPFASLPFLVAVLLTPATGLASLPKPDSILIEVPISIGGVVLKQTINNADRAWGGTGECGTGTGVRSCVYAGSDQQTGVATVDAAVHKQVSSFAIQAGRSDEGEYVFKGRLLNFETKQGLGLGDKGRKIPKAYPDAIKTANNTGYIIEGRGRSYMTIQTLDGRHITAISVVDGKHQG